MEKTHKNKIIALLLSVFFMICFGHETLAALKEVDIMAVIMGTAKPGFSLCVWAILTAVSGLMSLILWESCKRD